MDPWASETVSSVANSLAIVVLGIIGYAQNRKKKPTAPVFLWGVLFVFVSLGVFFQFKSALQKHTEEIQRRTYDTILIKEYQREFENDMPHKRMLAATAITEYFKRGKWASVKSDTDALDKVLEFFERLGFDEQRGIISAEVAHEYFSADIQFYYQACSEYIADTLTTEPTTFEHIKPLFDDVVNVEAKKTKRPKIQMKWSGDEMTNYCDHEFNSPLLKEAN